MKLMMWAALAGVALTTFATVKAEACDAGPLCRNKAAIFTDVKTFSQQIPRCPGLSDTEALDLASSVLQGQISYPAFKSVYALSCNMQTSLDVARDGRDAIVFTDLKRFSQEIPRCPVFSDNQATELARDIVDNRMAAEGFKQVYASSCNINTAITAASSPGLSSLYLDLKKFSQVIPRCPVFSDNQIFSIAPQILSGRNTLADFKSVYQTSCNFETALEASECLTPAGQPQAPQYRPQPRRPQAPPLRPVRIVQPRR